MAGAFKEFYPTDEVLRMALSGHSLMDTIPRNTKYPGKYVTVPVLGGGVAGRSNTFTAALANQQSTIIKEFLVTRARDYAIMGIDRESLLASEDDQGAFFNLKTEELEAQIYALGQSMSISSFRSGLGSYGTMDGTSSVAGATMGCLDPTDIVHFEPNQTIVLNPIGSAEGNVAIRAGTIIVSSVNYDGNVITFTTNITAGIAAAVNTDRMYVSGDQSAKMTGLAGWLPFTRPTSGDSFFGVDRSTNTTLFAGTAFDATGFTIREGLARANAQATKFGGVRDFGFLSPENWTDLADSLDTNHIYIDPVKGTSGFNYDGLVLNSPQGKIRILADSAAPSNLAYLLDMKTWLFRSLHEAPHLNTEDLASGILRDPNSDSYQVRAQYYGNFICRGPGWSAVAKLK
jgi:hypothetical protein